MFYSQLLLAKKGPLGKVWLAAHWDKKLTKQSILTTDIKATAEQVKKPVNPLSLRVSGHLLLGLSRIFAKKVAYLAADASEVITKLKAFRGGAAAEADLLEDGAAGGANIDMPEHMADLNLSLDVLGNGVGGLDLGAPFALGDGDDWGAIGSQSMPGTGVKLGAGAAYGGDDYGVIPGEMAEDEAGLGGLMGGDTFDVPGLGDHASAGRSTAGRSGASSYGDIERARRADSVASSADRLRAGAGMDLDADDRGSVVSDMDSDARGRVAKGRKSSLMPEGGLALASGGRKAGAAGTTGVDDLGLGGGDADDYGLGGIMGLSGGDMMMGDPGMVGDGQGGDYDGGGGYDYGRDYDGGDAGAVGEMDMGVAPRTPGLGRAFGAGAALEGEEGDVDMSGGSGSAMGLLTDSQLEQARAGAAADDAVRAAAARKEREASRKVKADKRKAEAAAAAKGASAASGGSRLAEASTILPSETIKEWLRDAGPITRPRTPRGPAMGAQLAAASNRYFTSVFDAEASGEGKARRKKAGAASTSSSVASLFPSLGPIATSLALLDVLDEAADASTASAAGPHTRAALAAASRSGGGGPDGDALLLTSPSYVPVDAEGRFAGMTALAGGVAGALSSGFAAVAACDPAALRVLLAHGSSRVAYPKKTQPAEEGAAAKGSQAQQLQEEEEQQQQEGDPGMVGDGQGGDYDAGGGYDYGRDFDAGDAGAVGDMDLGTAVAVDLDVAGEGLLNADGGIDGDVKGPGSAPSSVGRLSTQSPAAGAALAAGSPGSGRPSLLEAAMDEAAPGSALATGAGTPARGGMEEEEAAAEAAAAAGTPASGGVVSGAKWHATTVQMLLVLVGEMTSPALLRAGSKKRKSRGGGEEEAEEPGVKPVYDLSLLTSGKGTAGDPISFNELAAGSVRRTTALSFYQLLMLQTWDVIRCSQAEGPYSDVFITRTANLAPALAELRKAGLVPASLCA